MYLQLISLFLLCSLNAMAVDDKSIQELFKKYDQVMDHKKIELIDEVFTQKFIKDSGGKEELIQKIKDLKVPPQQVPTKVTWKKGKGNIVLANMKEVTTEKSKGLKSGTEFIVIVEDSKPKIDGTISDAD